MVRDTKFADDVENGSNRTGNRRTFLKVAGALGVTGLAGCIGEQEVGGDGDGGDSDGATTGEPQTDGQRIVNVLTWEGYGEEEIVSEFEEENDATVNIKLISSDPEGFNILKGGGTDQFDLITIDNTWAQRHAQAGTIETLNPDDYPAMDDFVEMYQWPFESFMWDEEMYAVPTRWGWDTLTVNTNEVPEEDYQTYDALWDGGPDGKYVNKTGIMDWPTWNIPKIALSLGYPPFEQDEEQLEHVEETLISMFENMKTVYTGTSAIRQAFLQEDITMAPVGNFAMSELRAQGNDWVDVVIPEAGGMQWTEGLCMVKDPHNRDLARKYQQKMISPKGQFNVSWKPSAKSAPVNTAAFDLFTEEQQNILMFNEDGFAAAETIAENTTPYEFSPITDTWTDMWTNAKARAGI